MKDSNLSKKILIIGLLAVLIFLLLAFLFWPKSINRQYVALSTEFVKIENKWAKVPQNFGEIRSDGSMLFPAKYVVYEKTDSVENIKRSSYINDTGDSVPYLYYRKRINTLRAVITPGSNQIQIRSKDYVIRNGFIYIKPNLFSKIGKIVRFYETPAAKLSRYQSETKSKPAGNTIWYILLVVLLIGGGIYWYTKSKSPSMLNQLKAAGIDLPDAELEHYILPDYSVNELKYLITIYFSKAKDLGLSYADVVKKAIPVPLETITKDLDDDGQIAMMEKASALDRKRFEGLLDNLKHYRTISPGISLSEVEQIKSPAGSMFSDAEKTDLPFELIMRFKNYTKFKFYMKNINALGIDIDFNAHLHKYPNPLEIEALIESYYTLLNAEVKIDFETLEKHLLNGGNTKKLEKSLFLLKNAGMDIPVKYLISIDLSGLDLDEIVPKAIKPAMKELNYPEIITLEQHPKPRHEPEHEKHEHSGKNTAQNIALEVHAELTYRLDLHSYINTAGLDTLTARIDEAMHSVIGRLGLQKSQKNPTQITDEIRKLNLDEDTSLSIVSLNITSIKIKPEEKINHRRSGYHS